jgi:hypothetical protein
MPAKWTRARAAKCVRRKDGTFRGWKGGRTKAQMKKQRNSVHGTRIHIGHWFGKWAERKPQVGDFFRMRLADGTYHAGATIYGYTPHGWRDTGSRRKPTPAQIARLCERSRPSTSKR